MTHSPDPPLMVDFLLPWSTPSPLEPLGVCLRLAPFLLSATVGGGMAGREVLLGAFFLVLTCLAGNTHTHTQAEREGGRVNTKYTCSWKY